MSRITLIDDAWGSADQWPTDPAQDVDPAITIHAIGDLHFGVEMQERMDVAHRAIASMEGTYARRVQVGDITDHGYLNSEWVPAVDWLDSLDENWLAVPGNHDYNDGNGGHAGKGWTEDDFLERSGRPVLWTEDVGRDIRLIGLSPPNMSDHGHLFCYFEQDRLDFLDNAANTTRSCLVFTHIPLKNSVNEAGKTGEFYFCHPHEDIVDILDSRPSIRGWISGHTHSSLRAKNLVMRYPLPNRSLAAINVSAIHSSPVKPPQLYQNNVSAFISVHPTRIDVRYLDHKAGHWAPYEGNTVTTVKV